MLNFYFTKPEKGAIVRSLIRCFMHVSHISEGSCTMEENQDNQEAPETPSKEDPGLFESIGSFPVWMLKIIDIVTPDFLIKKVPPQNK